MRTSQLQREIKKRGTLYFPFEHYYVNYRHPQYIMPLHWHDEIEIIKISEGSFFATINNETICAHAGDVILVNSGFLHGGYPQDCMYECIVFNLSFISGSIQKNRFLELIDNHSIFLKTYHPYEDNELHKVINTFFKAMREKHEGYELLASGCVLSLLGIFVNEKLFSAIGYYDTAKYKNISLLKNVLKYIDEHFAEHISLSDLSNIAQMSPKYFCRFFYDMTEHTPIDYVNYYRIEHSCTKLSSTNQTILEIALSCGFNDLSYFIKTFKRFKGIPPKQYAKQIIKIEN